MDHHEDPTGSLIGWLITFLCLFLGGICLLALLTRALS